MRVYLIRSKVTGLFLGRADDAEEAIWTSDMKDALMFQTVAFAESRRSSVDEASEVVPGDVHYSEGSGVTVIPVS